MLSTKRHRYRAPPLPAPIVQEDSCGVMFIFRGDPAGFVAHPVGLDIAAFTVSPAVFFFRRRYEPPVETRPQDPGTAIAAETHS